MRLPRQCRLFQLKNRMVLDELDFYFYLNIQRMPEYHLHNGSDLPYHHACRLNEWIRQNLRMKAHVSVLLKFCNRKL